MTALVGPVQELEDELSGMNTARYLPDAIGQQLDNIGIIIGLPRPVGATDAEYIQLLYGKIAEDISQGTPEQAIRVFQLFTQSTLIILDEYHNASLILEGNWTAASQAVVDQIIDIIQNTIPVGVRCDGLIGFDSTDAFAYDGSLPGLGYSDNSGIIGGKYPNHYLYLGPGFAYDGNDLTGQGYGTTADPLAGGAYLS